MDGNKRLTQKEEIISFLETEGFTELSEEDVRRYAPMSLWELPDDSELADYHLKN